MVFKMTGNFSKLLYQGLSVIIFSTLIIFSDSFFSENESHFFPLDQIEPGMKGIGRTVFQGSEIEEFDVEILGILKNIGPGQDAILTRLSGGPLEKTGVLAGMSGSPVYVKGQMIGAVAFAFPFSKEPIAGVTPIEQMISNFEQSEPPIQVKPIQIEVSSIAPHHTVSLKISKMTSDLNAKLTPIFSVSESLLQRMEFPTFMRGQRLRYIDTPLILSGATSQAADWFSSFLKPYGMSILQSGGVISELTNSELVEGSDIGPGSSIAVQLIRGDLGFSASASGTVTYRQGNKIYAFGHPWFSLGPVELPFSKAQVISLLPNLSTSFKIAVSTDLVGSITQDRSQGLYGMVGMKPKLIPLIVNLNSSRNSSLTFRYELVNDKLLTPFLTNFTILNTINSQERAFGDSTIQIAGKISLKGFPDIKIENLFSGETNSQMLASLSMLDPLNYLLNSGFDDINIQRISVDISSIDEKKITYLDRVWTERENVFPGETLNLSIFLRNTKGEEYIEKIPVLIPENVTAGHLFVTIADGRTLTAEESTHLNRSFIPRDLNQLIQAINNFRKNDRIYVRFQRSEPSVLLYGEEFSGLPPSFRSVLTSPRSSSNNLTLLNSSNLFEYELPATSFVIKGRHNLVLKIVE